MNTSSKCILLSGKGVEPKFFKTVSQASLISAYEHRDISADTILIAGGFSAVHPNSPYPLSATLQLNADFTDMDDAELKALAKTELKRCHNHSVPSYIIEPDSRVTLLGTDAAKLHDFMESYSGILDISPLLLKGYDPDLTRAQELHIGRDQGKFTISFTCKQPIDLSQCTHCGVCGSACPEQCLDEQLFLDFDRCSLCNACVEVCDSAAIDLHCVEERQLTTPAIVALRGAEGSLPEDTTGIYSIDTLPDLFATLYMREVQEVIGWNPDFCQYSARLQTGCSACLDACPHHAIKQDRDGVHIDHLRCMECGACLSSCPSAALHYHRFDDPLLLEYLGSLPLRPGMRLVIGDEAALHRYWWRNTTQEHKNLLFLEFPQTAALHAMHFLLLSALGASQVIILTSEEGKPTAQMQFGNTLLSHLLYQEQMLTTCSVEGLATILAQDIPTCPPRTPYQDFSYENRRLKLVDILHALGVQKTQEHAILIDKRTPDFGEIRCNEELCTGCMACINECRMGALSADSTGYSLKHRPALCIQCGICVGVCPEKALTPHRGPLMDEHFFGISTLAQAEPARCKGCGNIFGTQKSLEKVMAILTSKDMWDENDDLLAYCDECRVVNLYQSVGQEPCQKN